MDKEKVKKYIEDLEKGNRLDTKTLDYFFAKWILTLNGKNKETFNELLEGLKHKDQVIVSHIIDILGKIGDKQAIPCLNKMLGRKDLWGVVVYSLGIALIRLGDGAGANFLKEKILNPHVHRDTRLDAAKALIRLRVKGVFERDENIDFGGETMTPEWSKKLESLVNKLRTKQ